MSDWRYDRRNRHDVVTIPLIWVAFVLSLLVHIAALWIMQIDSAVGWYAHKDGTPYPKPSD